ncbi:MAG: CocE/NonD family hydrolase [Myxococcota bacterium]
MAILASVAASCQNRVVEVCRPATCTAIGKSCGEWPDGCGGMVKCPACSAGSACSGTGACECAPESCEELEKQCGLWKTRCGTEVECDTCPSTSICDRDKRSCEKEAVVMVPMADGVRLRTKIVLPPDGSDDHHATLLDRTPYRSPGTMQKFYDAQASFYARRGYAFVLQDVRGTHESDGELYLMRNEISDGRDTVNWIRAQAWSGKRLGTIGSSYEGYTALAAGVGTDLDLVLADDPCTGIYYWNRHGIQSMGPLAYYWGDLSDSEQEKRVAQATRALDLSALDMKMTGRTLPVWQDMLEHPAPTDPFWAPMTLDQSMSGICAPVFLANSTAIGWNDPAYAALELWSNGCTGHKPDVRLVVGNFAHGETIASVPYGLKTQVSGLFLKYLDKYLGGEPIDMGGIPAVQYFALEDSTPGSASTWPPPCSDSELLYLHSSKEGEYLDRAAPLDEMATKFAVNPAVANPCDPYDPEEVSVLYVGEVEDTIFVAGSPSVTLFASGSRHDADFILNLLDYSPATGDVAVVTWSAARGRWRDGYDNEKPLIPDEPFRVDVAFPPASWKFLPGHLIVLVVSGANCTMIENPHTGEPLYSQSRWERSIHSVFHDSAMPTSLLLPVVAREHREQALRPIDIRPAISTEIIRKKLSGMKIGDLAKRLELLRSITLRNNRDGM